MVAGARLENRHLKVRELVDRSVRLVILDFQREYLWKRIRAPKLVDSLYHRFPISMLLLWTSDVQAQCDICVFSR